MTRVRGKRDITIVLALLLLGCAHLCWAQQPSSVVDEPKNGAYHGRMAAVTAHTTWFERDGAPANIIAIAQTTDGFLWLGTASGLFRFDGSQFVSYPVTNLSQPLPSNFITALLSDRQGGLWIGYHTGGISHLLAAGFVINYSPNPEGAPGSTQKFTYAPDGTLWAIADYRLYRLSGAKWENFGGKHGLPNDPLFSLFIDSTGMLWVSTRGHLFSIRGGATEFTSFPTKTFIVVDMVEMPGGEIWICDAWKRVRPLRPSGRNMGWRINGYVRFALENNGTLWLAQDYRGVTHVASPASQARLLKEQGLTSEQTNAIFTDQDQNIWVGTSRGLDRFHETSVQHVSNTRIEYYPALCAPPSGGVWIATLARPLVYAQDGVLTPYGRDVGSAPIACKGDGSVWIVNPINGFLTGWQNGKLSNVELPAKITTSGTSIGLDYDGALLIAFRTFGLWRFDGAWKQVLDPELPQHEPLSIFRDPQGRVWLGYENGVVALRDGLITRTYLPAPGSNLGNVMAFALVNGRIFAAGTNGIALLEEKVFHQIALIRDGVLRGVSGMVQDHNGNLWLNTAAGLYCIRRDQLNSNLYSGVEYDHFDDRQGIQGTATQEDPLPSLVLDQSGPLWVSTGGAVLEVDPARLVQHPRPPSLVIEKVTYNGHVMADREHRLGFLSFPGRKLKELEIDYAAIDLAAPGTLRYRVMMEGKESVWQEVGERRQAFYDQLPPGNYRFRVAESNDVGQWTELRTPLAIQVNPAFYETSWFRLLIALASAGVLYFAYSVRIHFLTKSLRGKLQERAEERLRIARELHDTLLQSLHGLMLRFHFATSALPEDEPAREPLQLALQRADTTILEARQRIESLRGEVAEDTTFRQQILFMTQALDVQKGLLFGIREEGEPIVLVSEARSELCQIAREALVNTLTHAHATRAGIHLVYASSELRMCCSDNGVGIPTEVIRDGGRAGHWGLIGMAERAATIGGKLLIREARDGGTEVEVRIPARRAYCEMRGWRRLVPFTFPL